MLGSDSDDSDVDVSGDEAAGDGGAAGAGGAGGAAGAAAPAPEASEATMAAASEAPSSTVASAVAASTEAVSAKSAATATAAAAALATAAPAAAPTAAPAAVPASAPTASPRDGGGITSDLILKLRDTLPEAKFLEVKSVIMKYQERRKNNEASSADTKVSLERELRAIVTDKVFEEGQAAVLRSLRSKANKSARTLEVLAKLLTAERDANAGVGVMPRPSSSSEKTMLGYARMWRMATPVQHATDKSLNNFRRLISQRPEVPAIKELLALPDAQMYPVTQRTVPYEKGAIALFTPQRLAAEDAKMLLPLPKPQSKSGGDIGVAQPEQQLSCHVAGGSESERGESSQPIAAAERVAAKLRAACAAHYVALAGDTGASVGAAQCVSMMQLAVEQHMRGLLRSLVRAASHHRRTQALVMGGGSTSSSGGSGGSGGGSAVAGYGSHAAPVMVTTEPWRTHFMEAHAAHGALHLKRQAAVAKREGGETKRHCNRDGVDGGQLEELPPMASEASFKPKPNPKRVVVRQDVLALVAQRAQGVSGAAFVAAVNCEPKTERDSAR